MAWSDAARAAALAVRRMHKKARATPDLGRGHSMYRGSLGRRMIAQDIKQIRNTGHLNPQSIRTFGGHAGLIRAAVRSTRYANYLKKVK